MTALSEEQEEDQEEKSLKENHITVAMIRSLSSLSLSSRAERSTTRPRRPDFLCKLLVCYRSPCRHNTEVAFMLQVQPAEVRITAPEF